MAKNLGRPHSLMFVVPCFNEGLVLESTVDAILAQIRLLSDLGLCALGSSGVLLVDDGSTDNTWGIIGDLCDAHSAVSGLRLSRNKGHQVALLAGLKAVHSKSDVTISIDADLQDDIALSIDMLKLYHSGCQIVYGVRDDRSTDTFSKRLFAAAFYRLSRLLGAEIVSGHADFRLLANSALGELLRYQERGLFIRGIVPQLGFNTAKVFYARQRRAAGKPSYTFSQSFSLAMSGILSTSVLPLRLISGLGGVTAMLSLLGIFALIAIHVFGGTVQGWTSVMVLVSLLGGIQLLSLGVIGEYLSKVYLEVRKRPLYHIQARKGNLFSGG